ncbi:RNA-guided pseudouridylation complex pseudouridine synthase subunit Cbf5 [Candidatus Pacearchaeota archaeon]|jgi:H/ACA ribonucleoprotein complex subunit 4|nr:RNA-guided pseudouridylation complex pseudouridine synthase subunit Cbf5 [Candidatus Pacearchaeota archaeon]|tara:strand:+ start:1067 stop:1891 length:825 start_codon:yes stop_codon:yes gene_type:complete
MEEINDLINFSIINIDKPAGPTSFSITEFVRRELKLKKASHMGTLDPKVTGVLPITLGRACRLAQFLISHDKTYVGILHTHKEQDIKELQKIIDKDFTGEITQTPPHKSAVKRAPRKRTVYYFNLLETSDSKDFLFETKVEGGTYIRKICSDLGEKIGGAHMDELRRTEAGEFSEETAIKLPEFEKAIKDPELLKSYLVPAEDIIKKVLPVIETKDLNLKSLLTGKPLLKNEMKDFKKIKEDSFFALFQKKKFIGIYKKVKHKDIFAKPEFVYN